MRAGIASDAPREEKMIKMVLALALAPSFVAVAYAQQDAAPAAGTTKYAVSPSSGKAKSTPDMTQIPGTSTTGNASGPGGSATAAQPTLPSGARDHAEGSHGAAAGAGVVPSPAQ
jgi:hypothetical protein